ncbi:prolipoprotein diacylglyceryl transferase [Chryseobacterium sp.]|uniref:prolipoprotein diacylglyceryl transferase n=1 Tax=Chryseobacterium sp. TaxID=1871047 RepID=UPI002FC81E64
MLRYLQLGENSFIPTYNLFVGIGLALAMLYLQYSGPFSKLNNDQKYKIHLGIFLSLIIGFVGAFVFDAYSQAIPIKWSNFKLIGLTLQGGMIAGLFSLVVFLKINSLPIYKTLNMLTPPFCLAHIFGRIGCFFAGCCFGTPTNLPFGVKYPETSLAHSHFKTDIYLHPTQLYECIFILFVFLLVRSKFIKEPFLIYLILYSFFRFFIEFLRADDRGTIFNQSYLSPSQVISVTVGLIAIAVYYFRFQNKLVYTKK